MSDVETTRRRTGSADGPTWRRALSALSRSRELRLVFRAGQIILMVAALAIVAEECSAQSNASATSQPSIAMGSSQLGNVTSAPAGPADGVNGWTAPSGWDFVENGLGGTAFTAIAATIGTAVAKDDRFVVSVDVPAVSGVGGIVLGYKDDKNYYRLVINRVFGAIALEQVVGGVASPLKTYGPVPSEGEIRLTTAVDHGRLTAYLGGQPILGGSVNPAGKVGLTVVSGTATFSGFYLGTW